MNYKLIPKSQSKLMRLIGFFYPKWMTDFWTTYRLPFGQAKVTYPDTINNPSEYKNIIEHEEIHVEQFNKWYGPAWMMLLATLLPLPILFSGRWFIERKAYLHNIINHYYPVEAVVEILWSQYLWCWPKPLMRRWFKKQLKKHKEQK